MEEEKHEHQDSQGLSNEELEEELTISATSPDEDVEREGRFDELLEERVHRSGDAG